MILRLIINLVRWTWGYPAWHIPENPDGDFALIMGVGAVIDVFAAGTAILAVQDFINEKKRRARTVRQIAQAMRDLENKDKKGTDK